MGSTFGADQAKAMEASFKEFISRPENRPLVEAHQRKEVKQAIQLQDKVRALDFRDKVLSSDLESQKNIAPFLSNRVLRRLIQTFANDPKGDFDKWASNPRVIEMLSEAKRLMDEGHLTEEEVERALVNQLQDPKHEAHEEFKKHTKQVARLPTDQLVEALNEHLTERRQGNEKYRAGDLIGALAHYERAAAVVDFVKGLSRADQAEVDVNKVAVYLNIAAVRMAQGEYGAAVEKCTAALDLFPGNRKALMRRAKAEMGRHEYSAAKKDIGTLWKQGATYEADNLQGELIKAQKAGSESEKKAFQGILQK